MKKKIVDLPIEVLHLIFDHCKTETILLVRRVCRQLYTASNTYNRFRVIFNSNSRRYMHGVSRNLQSGNVTSLTFFNENPSLTPSNPSSSDLEHEDIVSSPFSDEGFSLTLSNLVSRSGQSRSITSPMFFDDNTTLTPINYDFHNRQSRCIRPRTFFNENHISTRINPHPLNRQSRDIMSPILSNQNPSSTPINQFFSIFNINKFNRLRSVTLYQVNDKQLEYFLGHMIIRSPISLIIESSERLHTRTLSLISSAIDRFKLSKLCLNDLNDIAEHVSWINQCGLEHLSINACHYRQCMTILRQLAYLRAVTLTNCRMSITNSTDNTIVDYNFALPLFSTVTSLIISDQSLSIKNLEVLLSESPRLIHLKLDSRRAKIDSMFDGHRWEQFIQNVLPTLKTFQIHFSYNFVDTDNPPSLHALIHRFQTPFWLEVKRWFITCDYLIRTNTIRIYTTSTFSDSSDDSLILALSSMNSTYQAIRPSTNGIVDGNTNQVSTGKNRQEKRNPLVFFI